MAKTVKRSCPNCLEVGGMERPALNHWLHLIFTVMTASLWGWAWLFRILRRAPWRCRKCDSVAGLSTLDVFAAGTGLSGFLVCQSAMIVMGTLLSFDLIEGVLAVMDAAPETPHHATAARELEKPRVQETPPTTHRVVNLINHHEFTPITRPVVIGPPKVDSEVPAAAFAQRAPAVAQASTAYVQPAAAFTTVVPTSRVTQAEPPAESNTISTDTQEPSASGREVHASTPAGAVVRKKDLVVILTHVVACEIEHKNGTLIAVILSNEPILWDQAYFDSDGIFLHFNRKVIYVEAIFAKRSGNMIAQSISLDHSSNTTYPDRSWEPGPSYDYSGKIKIEHNQVTGWAKTIRQFDATYDFKFETPLCRFPTAKSR